MLGRTLGFPHRPYLFGRGLTVQGGSVVVDRATSFIAASGTWNTTGTPTAIQLSVLNLASNGNSRLMELRVGSTVANNVSVFSVTVGGQATANALVSFGFITAAGGSFFNWTSRSKLKSSADGIIELFNAAETGFTRLNFGGTTSGFPAIGSDTGGPLIQILAADGASKCNFAVYNTFTSTTNFEYLGITWSANVCNIKTDKGSGGGTIRDLIVGNIFRFSGADVKMLVPSTLSIQTGTNQRAGNAVLVAGTVTVANTTVTANTLVMLTRKTSGGTLGTAITYTVTAATSFTITSDSALDTSTFSYVLIENPA